MKVTFKFIEKNKNEQVLFEVHQKNDFLEEIANLLENYQVKQISVKDFNKNQMVFVNMLDIIYIEYIDRKCFFYTKDKVYEKRVTLNKLIPELSEEFIQVSKNTLINIYSVKEIKSSLLNGNLYCLLLNKEEILVSRHFSKSFKEKIQTKKYHK